MSLKYPDNIAYHPEHAWFAAKDNGNGLVGITDFAQDQLGEVAFVELPSVGAHFKVGEEFGSIESVKAASSLVMPVSGKIIKINEELDDNPEMVNSSPYEEAWIIEIETDSKDNKELLSAADYKKSLEP